MEAEMHSHIHHGMWKMYVYLEQLMIMITYERTLCNRARADYNSIAASGD
jgi:hypothetical protein